MSKFHTPLFFMLLIFASKAASGAGHKKVIAPADTSMAVSAGDYIVLNNGIISATITKTSARIVSYKYKGIEVLKDGYYSMEAVQLIRSPSLACLRLKPIPQN